ncbi:MAG: ABC transporter substrate-binding protein [Acetobacteraceae bacterium]|nr:ABC transporter substrate-binding protein [Acetobacteraceae bacterium]
MGKTRKSAHLAWLAAGGLALAGAVAGPAVGQTLTLAVAASPTSLDPHYHNLAPNNSLADHIFGALVEMDANTRPEPGLALSWKPISDLVWELKLRPGVKFHDGSAFTAEDIAYTLARVPTVKNSPGSFLLYTRGVTKVEVVDPLTVRLTTGAVTPLLPIDLSQVAILPHGLGPEPTSESFNALKSTIGTGPYRVTAYNSGDRVELARNDAYWGEKPHWEKVHYRMIPNDSARTSALLAGDVDFIEAVPTSDLSTLRKDKRVALAEAVSLRFAYLFFDRTRDGGGMPFVSGPDGEALAKNPLADVRVRRALSMAINRAAIVDRVMEGAAVATGQFLAKGSTSYVDDLAPPAYDPEAARKLLAEAGYPRGFRITLQGPNDRYVNDEKVIQAVGQMWTRIGLQTKVDAITWPSFIGRASKQEFSAFFVAWGVSSGEASNPLRALIHTFDASRGFGSANRARYSNPALDAVIERGMAITDDAAREVVLKQATRMAMEDVAMITLYQQKNIWGMKPDLRYVARADEATHAFAVYPAK